MNKNIEVKPKLKRRKKGEHYFSNPTNGIPRCIDCGCDEDDAYVGGEDCSYGYPAGSVIKRYAEDFV